MSIRVGIDVGGTFTDAVVIDNETFELIGQTKIHTTHDDKTGVAAGIILALKKVLKDHNLSSEDVIFIAHGTTQATNALLEGDVEKVGVIGVGEGVEGYKVKSDTEIGNIELAPGKFLYSESGFVSTHAEDEAINEIVESFKAKGIKVVVVSGAYSVDDPRDELRVKSAAVDGGMICTCGHEISKLYGLKIRTRTAVINASILPKMMQTASMTEDSVQKAGIKAPLMIMRCDGGVMSVQEVKRRPVLTMLSGPAAGVAGALMYEKISEGIFLEVGGTSTDISTIHNGQVMVNYAEVGGHKTYINSLDVRTVGIAGGSMIRATESGIVDVGPRSAHIAGLPYITFVPPEELGTLKVVPITPCEGDYSDYIAVEDVDSGKRYALTLTCAANAYGIVADDNYSRGNTESARKGFEALSKYIGKPLDDLLRNVQDVAAAKNSAVVESMIRDYSLEQSQIILVGGGGGAAAVVPYLAGFMGMKFKIAKNAQVISPIGVALAMVREEVERTSTNPSDEEILSIRKEAETMALKSGAAPGTVEITVEIDPRRSLIKAIAVGATELRVGKREHDNLTSEQLKEICAESMGVSADKTIIRGSTESFHAIGAEHTNTSFFGFIKKRNYPIRLVDNEGIIRVQMPNANAFQVLAKDCKASLSTLASRLTEYTEGGERIPETYVCAGPRIINLSKLINLEQMQSLLDIELQGLDETTPMLILMGSKMVQNI